MIVDDPKLYISQLISQVQSLISQKKSEEDILSLEGARAREIKSLEEISSLLEGIEFVVNNKVAQKGGPITLQEFQTGVENLKNHEPLWTLYQLGLIGGWLIDEASIQRLTQNNYIGLRSYPIMSKDNSYLTFALVPVQDSMQSVEIEVDGVKNKYLLTEVEGDIEDTYDPSPPKVQVNLLSQADKDQLDRLHNETLLRFYK